MMSDVNFNQYLLLLLSIQYQYIFFINMFIILDKNNKLNWSSCQTLFSVKYEIFVLYYISQYTYQYIY